MPNATPIIGSGLERGEKTETRQLAVIRFRWAERPPSLLSSSRWLPPSQI